MISSLMPCEMNFLKVYINTAGGTSVLRICAPCLRTFYEIVQKLTFYEFIKFNTTTMHHYVMRMEKSWCR
jgi:hypothetical protein